MDGMTSSRLAPTLLSLALLLAGCDASLVDPLLAPDTAEDAASELEPAFDISVAADADPALDAATDPDATLAPDPGPPDAAGPDVEPDAEPEPPPTGEPIATSTLPADLTDALLAALEAGYEASDAPGVALGVVLPGQGAFHAAIGFAQADPPAQAHPLQRYRVGSITKTFTAALVLELVADGTLALDDTAASWLPELALDLDLDPTITVRQLLTHTSGLFNFTDDHSFVGLAAEPATPAEVLAFALGHAAEFAPGQGWGYSNTNYVLLGALIEAVTGQPYHQRLRQRLLEPLALADTFLDDFETLPGGTVTGHLLGADATGVGHMSWAWAAGAAASNTADLCAWLDAYLGGAVLPPALTQAIPVPEALPGGGQANYGLGVQLAWRAGRRVVGHTGSTVGFVSEVFIDPESGACVTLLLNDFFGVKPPIAQPVWQAVLDALK